MRGVIGRGSGRGVGRGEDGVIVGGGMVVGGRGGEWKAVRRFVEGSTWGDSVGGGFGVVRPRHARGGGRRDCGGRRRGEEGRWFFHMHAMLRLSVAGEGGREDRR